MAPRESVQLVAGEDTLSAPERRLLAAMPLHAITVLHGEDGLRERLLIESGRFPAGERGRVDAALALMSRLHERDRRQRQPYSCHPLRVTIRILSHHRVTDPDVACAALLHDTVEDHAGDIAPGGSRQDALAVLAGQFGARAVGLVAAVTRPPRWRALCARARSRAAAGRHCQRSQAVPPVPRRPERAGGAPGGALRLCRCRFLAGQAPGDLNRVAGVVDLLGADRGPVAVEVLPVQAAVEEDPDLAVAPAAYWDRLLVLWRFRPEGLAGGQVGGVHHDLEHQRVDHAQVRQGRFCLLGGGPGQPVPALAGGFVGVHARGCPGLRDDG